MDRARDGAPMASTSVFLNVQNLEKSVEFYGALGFRVAREYRGRGGELRYVDLDLDGAELSLGWIGANDDPEFRRWVSGELGAGVIVYVDVPDVDALHERARRAGAVIEAPLEERSYGRAFNLNDPDGYVVCFFTEPGRAPRAKGSARRAGARRRVARRRPGKRRR